ncbi:MAG TPA: sugar phosphate isomerase/epimerase [Gaiellaceae bacterium]
MRVGLFLALFGERPLDEALDAAAMAGCELVEVASTASSRHCRPAELLADATARAQLLEAVGSRGLAISALACHGNALHPDEDVAAAADRDFRESVRLAAELGVGTVITFSGCPGESERSLRPSWVTCSWPDDYPETLEWQWRERVLPYWVEAGSFAREHEVRVAIEPHPGFVVYNTASMLRLRAAAGESVGVNFDPSHLFWQQMDPIACARALGDAIFHVHAKDTGFDESVLALDGVLEIRPGPTERAWIFRSVGEGHPVAFWRDLVGVLREVGYHGALSIEHEDPLLPAEEGLARAVATLREALA